MEIALHDSKEERERSGDVQVTRHALLLKDKLQRLVKVCWQEKGKTVASSSVERAAATRL